MAEYLSSSVLKNSFFIISFLLLVKFQLGETTFSCFQCTDARRDMDCHRTEECREDMQRCYTRVKDGMLLKRCMNKLEDCLPLNVSYDIFNPKGMHFCCETSLCNNKSRWYPTKQDILEKSMGVNPNTFVGVIMIYQFFMLAIYSAAVTYIIMQAPKKQSIEISYSSDEDESSAG